MFRTEIVAVLSAVGTADATNTAFESGVLQTVRKIRSVTASIVLFVQVMAARVLLAVISSVSVITPESPVAVTALAATVLVPLAVTIEPPKFTPPANDDVPLTRSVAIVVPPSAAAALDVNDPVSVVVPVTPSVMTWVELNVVAPVTPSVPPTVVLPVSVDAPVTPSVPLRVVFPAAVSVPWSWVF